MHFKPCSPTPQAALYAVKLWFIGFALVVVVAFIIVWMSEYLFFSSIVVGIDVAYSSRLKVGKPVQQVDQIAIATSAHVGRLLSKSIRKWIDQWSSIKLIHSGKKRII